MQILLTDEMRGETGDPLGPSAVWTRNGHEQRHIHAPTLEAALARALAAMPDGDGHDHVTVKPDGARRRRRG